MGHTAFIFPGQGSQSVGMGRDLFQAFPEAKAVFDAANDALTLKLSDLCFNGPEESLRLTAHTQPAILTVSVAVHAVLSKRVGAPAFVAGHSLGEYSALVAAGVLPFADAVRLVRARGTFMQDAVPAGEGAMAVVLGLRPEVVTAVCAETAKDGEVLAPANYNSPEQTVIAGHAAAVTRAEEPLKAAGAKRFIPLAVSAPFHCALMAPVRDRLKDALSHVRIRPVSIPVISNVEAKANSASARVAELLVEQVTSPVRWVESVEELHRLGVTRFVELGPGRVLCGLVKRILKDVEVFNVEDCASLQRTLNALEAPG